MNKYGNAKMLFETLKHEEEIFRLTDSTIELDKKNALKPCSEKALNTYVNAILQDMDPDQCVEEEYKRKND